MDGRTKIIIFTLQIAAFTIGTDFTGVLLLVSGIENEFAADITTTQWVLNLYALSFSVFMITGGRLGDMYGRRRLMLVGLAVFLAATVACLFSPSIGWLIGARGVQGIGAALLFPSILGLAANIGGKENRSFVLGLILAGITSGNVVGPLISGVVVSFGDWRLFFLVNALLGILAVALVLRFLEREEPAKTNERIDFLGIATLAGAIVALMYGLDVGADWGWTAPLLLAVFVLSAVLFVAFPFAERRAVDPMISQPLMHNRQFVLALALNALMMPAIYAAFLYLPQYFGKVLGWTVLAASFGMAPLMVLLAFGSVISGRLYDTIGPKRLLMFGYVLVAIGAAWIIFMAQSWGYAGVVPAMLMIGLGGAVATGASGTAAISTVMPERAGMAGGLSFTVHLAFGAVGVAAITAAMFASSLSSIKRGLSAAGIDLPTAAITRLNAAAPTGKEVANVLANHYAAEADKVRSILVDGFTNGLSYAYWLAFLTALLGIAAVLAIDEQKLRPVEGDDRTTADA